MAADPEKEALRRKNLAETKYKNSNLKSALRHAEVAHRLCPRLEGISSMHTAFQILSVASDSSAGEDPDWYKIFQVEPFSSFNSIKKQFRKLALVLHPDRNPYLGCEEAFKLVNEGFRVFSDRIRRKEFDRKLRNLIQEERVDGLGGDEDLETFWTACSRCRLLHMFERKYLGHNLVCPSCKKSFEAVEVGENGEEEQDPVEEENEELESDDDDDERLIDMMLKKKIIKDGDERLSDMISKRKIDDDGDDDVRLCDMILKRKKGKGNGAVLEEEMGNGAVREEEMGNGASLAEEMGNGAAVEEEMGNGAAVEEEMGDGERAVLEENGENGGSGESDLEKRKKGSNERRESEGITKEMSNGDLKGKGSGETIGSEPSGGRLKRRTGSVEEILARSSANGVEDGEKENGLGLEQVDDGEEGMTLAEMQLEAKRKWNQKEAKLKEKECDKDEGVKETKRARRGALMSRILEIEKEGILEDGTDMEIENQEVFDSGSSEEFAVADIESSEDSMEQEFETRWGEKKNGNLEHVKRGTSRNKLLVDIKRHHGPLSGDSRFFDFDQIRVETSFKKGQVWATYDDDGMPRRYGLVDEVVSVNPLEVKMSWLDLQNNTDEEMESRLSCGTFKVTQTTSFNTINTFSHVMECERAAKELYRIYPKKGSVWAVYNEPALSSDKEKHCYHIVVSLTAYSEAHGLSIGYLEKADEFKTVFRRKEIGSHAVKYIGKDDLRLFSHQIPARKLSGDDVPDNLKDCWVLDPASLPSDLLPASLN